MNKTLVTGSAGFIGSFVAKKLLDQGKTVVGVDSVNDYYDVSLKRDRLKFLAPYENHSFHEINIANYASLNALFERERPDTVINLAAQAGVRYSLQNPHAYAESNLTGFINILECCRHHEVKHLAYASSSSVYGANTKMPFSVHDKVDHPVSLYAATKKSNELMAHSYSHLYQLPTTGLRFFTVYGPFGRPDMSPFLFARRILTGQPIDVFNFGNMKRDFTYIDDIVEGVVRTAERIPAGNPSWNSADPDSATSYAPYRIYNIGNNRPEELMRFIQIMEEKIGKKAILNMLPMQAGDVHETFADVQDLMDDVGFRPDTPLEEGISRFIDWYRQYYSL